MSDFNIKVTVRNARLLRAVRSKFETAAEMCRVAGIAQSQASPLMTMRASPFRKDGELTAAAEAIVSALGVPAGELWPAHVARLKAKKATVEIEMDAETFAAIAYDSDCEKSFIYREAISRWSQKLTDRQREVVALRQSGATYDEVAKEVGASRERARQIELSAYRKMRDAARKDSVRDAGDIL